MDSRRDNGHQEDFDQLMLFKSNSTETSPDKIKPYRKSSSSEINKAGDDKDVQCSLTRYFSESDNDHKKQYPSVSENLRNKKWSKNSAISQFDLYLKPTVMPPKKAKVENLPLKKPDNYNLFKSPASFKYNSQLFKKSQNEAILDVSTADTYSDKVIEKTNQGDLNYSQKHRTKESCSCEICTMQTLGKIFGLNEYDNCESSESTFSQGNSSHIPNVYDSQADFMTQSNVMKNNDFF